MKQIEGTSNYFVTEDGRVFNQDKQVYLKPHWSGNRKRNNRYLIVSISIGGTISKRKIHRMVAQAFIENPNNYPQVNHIDGDRSNNKVSNLEWCNNSRNQLHAYDHNLHKSGEDHAQSKFSNDEVHNMRESRKAGMKMKDIASTFKVSLSHVREIIHFRKRTRDHQKVSIK